MLAFNTFTVFTCILLVYIHAVIATDYSKPITKALYARHGQNYRWDIVDTIESNHLQSFCSTWLGFPKVKTITKTTTEVSKVQQTRTVNAVSTVVKGTTTLTTAVTVTKRGGSNTIATSYVTKLGTSYVTDSLTATTIQPVETRTISTIVATSTLTSIKETITSLTITTVVDISTITSTTSITPTASIPAKKRRDGGPRERERRRQVPDSLKYADDDLISTGCSSAICKTATKTVTITSTSTKGIQTLTAYTSTTTVPGKTRTVTSTATLSTKSDVTATSQVTSIVTSTVSSKTTITIPSTVTTVISSTMTITVPSTSIITDTQTTTSTSTSTVLVTSTISATSVTPSICPAQTKVPGVGGLATGDNGSIVFSESVSSTEDCCFTCHDPNKRPGCVAWVSMPEGTRFSCWLIIKSRGTSSTPTTTCPRGLDNASIFSAKDIANSMGGSGPCTDPGRLQFIS